MTEVQQQKPPTGTIETRAGARGTTYRAIWNWEGRQLKQSFPSYDGALAHLTGVAEAKAAKPKPVPSRPASVNGERKPQIGSVEIRYGGGSYRAIWRAKGRVQKKSFDTNDEACDFLDAMARDIRKGGVAVDLAPPRTPYGEVFERWLATVPKAKRQKHRNHYNGRIKSYWQDVPVGEMTKDPVQTWLNALTDNPAEYCEDCEDAQAEAGDDEVYCSVHWRGALAEGSVRNYWNTVNPSLQWAAENGYLPGGAPRCTPGNGQSRKIFLPPARVEALLNVARQHFPAWFALLHILAHTGMRIGEARNLRRDDYHPEDDYLMVVSRKGAQTKNRKSRRVDLWPCCVKVLNAQLAVHDHEPVFPVAHGQRLHPGNFRRRIWFALVELAGEGNHPEGRLRIHDLRHSHVSDLLVVQRWPVEAVAARVGHADSSVTQRIYAHLIPGYQQELIKRGRIQHGQKKGKK